MTTGKTISLTIQTFVWKTAISYRRIKWLQLHFRKTTLAAICWSDFIQFSHSVVTNSLWPCGLQLARLPCPSPTPRACSNSSPSRWCHPAISSSVSPSPPAFNLSHHQGLYHWVSYSYQVAKVLEFQLQHQRIQWRFRTDFFYDWLVGSPCNLRDSQESFPTPQFKASNLWHSAFFIVQLSHPYMTTGKIIALTRCTFAGKVMSLFFNMLSRLS